MSLQMLSSVFANVSVHHRLVLMKGVLAARVIQLCVYHRALEERKGQNRASQGSESGLQISHFYHTFLTLPTLRRRIRAEKRSGIRRFFSELPQFSFIHCLNASGSIKFNQVLTISNPFWVKYQGHWLSFVTLVATDSLSLHTFSFHFFGI